jgi:hypothetical protein
MQVVFTIELRVDCEADKCVLLNTRSDRQLSNCTAGRRCGMGVRSHRLLARL